MSKEITITVEEDVAYWLEQQVDVSAYVTKLVVTQMLALRRGGRTVDPKVLRELREQMESRSTEEGRAEAGRRLEEAAAKWTPELMEFRRQLLEDWAPHRLHEWPQA
jgi:urease accessory protein UreF